MATIGQENRGALIVVDAQVGVVGHAFNSVEIVSNMVRAVARARSAGVPVIWVQQQDENLRPGSPAWEWAGALSPESDETIFAKKYNSSFEETDLQQELDRIGVGHIVLLGAATNWCIRATAHAALERGYDLTLVSDAHTTGTQKLGGKTIEGANIIAELNGAMSHASYPGRTNTALPAEQIDFDSLAND